MGTVPKAYCFTLMIQYYTLNLFETIITCTMINQFFKLLSKLKTTYHTNLIRPDMKLNIAIMMEPVCRVKQKQQRLSGPKLRVKSSSSVGLRWLRRPTSFVPTIVLEVMKRDAMQFFLLPNKCSLSFSGLM